MKIFRTALRATVFAAAGLAFATQAEAQATRTWVSGVGDDVNPCSRTAPCKTFAGAISKTARGGEISVLDQGGFGSVTITKSITIDGTGVLASILASGTNGIVINISDAADVEKAVRIRGLSINGAGSTPGLQGIKVIAANKVSVEDVVVDGFKEAGIGVTGPARVFVKNTTVRNNAGAGISVAAGGQVALSGVAVVHNGTGLAGGGAGATIVSYGDNVLYGNAKDGAPTSSAARR